MLVRITHIDEETANYSGLRRGRIYKVVEKKIAQYGQKYPSLSKVYYIRNPKKWKQTVKMYWYEVKEIEHQRVRTEKGRNRCAR